MSRTRKEVEVKLHVTSREAMLRRLKRLGAKAVRSRVHEMNTLFDAHDGALARRGRTMRIRVERLARTNKGRPAVRNKKISAGEVVTLTYKCPVGGGRRKSPRYKVREEYEVQVSDSGALEHILRGLGLRPWFRYEKFRSAFRLKGLASLLVDFDETPVGDFLELEGKPGEIDRAAALLGYAPGDYIVGSYGGLYMKSLRVKGRAASQNEPAPDSGLPDMLFSKRSPRRT